MFQGQYLFFEDTVYSPWMKRGGNNIRVTVDLIANTTSAEVQIELLHKKSEDAGDGSPVDANVLKTDTVGQTVHAWSGLEDLVRYRIKCDKTSGSSSDYVLFRMLTPVWFESVNAAP